MKGGHSAAAGGAPASYTLYTDTMEQPAKRNSAECGSVLITFLIILTCVLFLPDGASQAASAMKKQQ